MHDKDFAGRILGWVFYAQRPLKMSELQTALNFDSEDLSFVDESSSPDVIIQICGGLIDRNSDGLVDFTHALVRDYLRDHPLDKMTSNTTLSLACVIYCQYPVIENKCKTLELYQRKGEFKFSDYTASFWAVHAVHIVQSERNFKLEKAILETFSSDTRREAMEQLRDLYYTTGKSLLHVLVENGLSVIFMSPLNIEIERM